MKLFGITSKSSQFIFLLILFCILVLSFRALAQEVPLSPYYPLSNEDWWLYQFDGYPDYTNHNCGPASAAMIINYLRNKGVTTTYYPVISSNYPDVHCYARWNYCQGNPMTLT